MLSSSDTALPRLPWAQHEPPGRPLLIIIFNQIDYYELMIQLHRLEGFYRVAMAAGYARAARTFPYPITQPGVHAQVRRLEQDLGVRLFEQVAKDQLVPTRAGRTMLEFCAPFFERLPEIVDQVRRSAAAGRIRIEAGALEIHEVMPAWLMRVSREHPQIEIDLVEVAAPSTERLLDGSVDLIVEYQPRIPRGIAARRIATHRSFLVRSASLAGGERRPRLTDLARQPFVALNPGPQRELQFSALRALGAEPSRITSAPSVTSVLAFVAAGLGCSLIPWPTATGPRVPGVAVSPLSGKGTRFPVSASWRKTRDADPVLAAVLRLATRDASARQ
jgi:DNA-binding transcriptional LysR family regulator